MNSCYMSCRPQDHHHLSSCYTTESFISELNNKGNDIIHSTRCQLRTTGGNDKTLCGSKLHSLVSSGLFHDARALPKDCTLGSRGPKSQCIGCSYISRAERCSSGVGGHAEFSVKLLLVVILHWCSGADVADVPHNNLSPYKHPLGWPPPAYKMMTIHTHRTQVHVLWG